MLLHLALLTCLLCEGQAGPLVARYCKYGEVYQDKCMYAHPTGRIYPDASAYCETLGKQLMTHFTLSHVIYASRKWPTASGQYNGLWVGVDDIGVTHRHFKWIKTNERINSEAWATLRPGWPHIEARYNCCWYIHQKYERIQDNWHIMEASPLCTRRPRCSIETFGEACDSYCHCEEIVCQPRGCVKCRLGYAGRHCNVSVVVPIRPEAQVECRAISAPPEPYTWPQWRYRQANGTAFLNIRATRERYAKFPSNYAVVLSNLRLYCEFFRQGVEVECAINQKRQQHHIFQRARNPLLFMLSSFAVEGYPVAFMCTKVVDYDCGEEVDEVTQTVFYLNNTAQNGRTDVEVFSLDRGRVVLSYFSYNYSMADSVMQCKIGLHYSNTVTLRPLTLAKMYTSRREMSVLCRVTSLPGNATKTAVFQGGCLRHAFEVNWFILSTEGTAARISNKHLYQTTTEACDHGFSKVTSTLEFTLTNAEAEKEAPNFQGIVAGLGFNLMSQTIYRCCNGQYPESNEPIPCKEVNITSGAPKR